VEGAKFNMSINLSEEKKYLSELQNTLLKELSKLKEGTEKHSSEFYQSMKYLWENRSDMDAMEIFSNEQSINQIVRSGEFTAEQLNKIEKMLESPYFARIDFICNGEDSPMEVYIGRFSFIDGDHFFWVYDWRSPISSIYYDYEIGPASYEAPLGAINGELTTKRQYKIRNGNLEYALESNMNINDEILQRELSNNSDQKMKNILATIQKEQNKIIVDKAPILWFGITDEWKRIIAEDTTVIVRDYPRVKYEFINSNYYSDTANNVEYQLKEISSENVNEVFQYNKGLYGFWESKELFIENGLGFILLDGNKIIGHAISASVEDGEVEIDIRTDEQYRGKGIARYLTSCLIDKCLKTSRIPKWDCAVGNVPSNKLALKLGFEKVNEYPFSILSAE